MNGEQIYLEIKNKIKELNELDDRCRIFKKVKANDLVKEYEDKIKNAEQELDFLLKKE